jgi:hypothetical protein
MGMQVEFNWYLVLKKDPEEIKDGHFVRAREGIEFVETGIYYRTSKSEARIYPVGGVVPLIHNDVAIGMVYIRECSQRLGLKNEVFTVVDYDLILSFDDTDPVGNHYTDMYSAYKKKQEVEDHGGKFKTEEFVNALERRSFEAIMNKIGE